MLFFYSQAQVTAYQIAYSHIIPPKHNIDPMQTQRRLDALYPQSKIQNNVAQSTEAVSFRRIATVEQLKLEKTHMQIHSQLYRIPRAATPRGIITIIYIPLRNTLASSFTFRAGKSP